MSIIKVSMRLTLSHALTVAAMTLLVACGDSGAVRGTVNTNTTNSAASKDEFSQGNFVLEPALATPQVDERNLPDLKGAYDKLIPVADDYPIPDIPSRLFDTTNMRNGRYLRPRIPSSRTTADGRVGIGNDASGGIQFMLFTPEKLKRHYTLVNDGSADFMADQVWRANNKAFMPKGFPYSPVMLGLCDTSHATLNNELYNKSEATLHRNPKPWGNKAEAYEFTIITSPYDPATQHMSDKLVSIPVRVVVKNPKTAEAQIAQIERIGEPIIATLPYQPSAVFEPSITGDGRLFVARIRGTLGSGGGADAVQPREWTDQNGVPHQGYFDMVYGYNSPDSGYKPCDPRGWTALKPISYAHHHDAVRERYGFAKYPLRDSEGTLVGEGSDAGIAYPWIDHRGANIFFTPYHRLAFSDETSYSRPEDADLFSTAFPQVIPLIDAQGSASGSAPQTGNTQPHLMLPKAHVIRIPGHCSDCEDTDTTDHSGPHRGFGVFGLWTKGKMVLTDDLINNTDFAFRASNDGHRLARLYHGTGGVVRVGNGRTNVGLQKDYVFDSYWPQNDSVMESLENKLNFSPNMRPADPHDVVWTINNGHASSEFAFDEYMDEQAIVISNMNPSMTVPPPSMTATPLSSIKWLIPNFGDRFNVPLRMQNAATGTTGMVPPYGAVIGDSLKGTRIEPVALGGVNGKGLWMRELTGVSYTIPTTGKNTALAVKSLYAGVFIDPRFNPASTFNNRLFTFPTGAVSMVGNGKEVSLLFDNATMTTILTQAVSTAPATWQASVPIGGFLREKNWTHFGFEVNATRILVYLNGFLYATVNKSAAPRALMLADGAIVVGSPSAGVKGFRGWIDEVFVTARGATSAEEACNHARGSVVRTSGDAQTARYPDTSHMSIANALGEVSSSRYQCLTDYMGEGYGYLMKVPQSQRVGALLKKIQPLRFNQPRPDESKNTFCLSCHRDDHASESLQVKALEPHNIPMQLDSRRQPLQPFPAVVGRMPAGWLWGPNGNGPGREITYERIREWLFVDEVQH